MEKHIPILIEHCKDGDYILGGKIEYYNNRADAFVAASEMVDKFSEKHEHFHVTPVVCCVPDIPKAMADAKKQEESGLAALKEEIMHSQTSKRVWPENFSASCDCDINSIVVL